MKVRNNKKLICSITAVVVVLVALFTGIGIYNTPTNRVNRHLEVANKYLEEMDYEQAAVEFNKAIEIDPMSVEAYLGKAKAYEGMGDIDMAIETLKVAYNLTGDERLKTRIDELNSLVVVTGNQTVSGGQEVIEESIHTEYSFYDIDEMPVLGCSIWDDDWFENVCDILGCPIIEKKASEGGTPLEDALEGQFGYMIAEHNIDAVGTGADAYSLSIFSSPEDYYSVHMGVFINSDFREHHISIKSPEIDTTILGNLPFNVGDTYELWYRVMNIEDIKSIGKEQVEVYEEEGFKLFSYYYGYEGGEKYSSCSYLEYIYEDANQNRYSFQVYGNDHRHLSIDISVHDGAISSIDVDARSWECDG